MSKSSPELADSRDSSSTFAGPYSGRHLGALSETFVKSFPVGRVTKWAMRVVQGSATAHFAHLAPLRSSARSSREFLFPKPSRVGRLRRTWSRVWRPGGQTAAQRSCTVLQAATRRRG